MLNSILKKLKIRKYNNLRANFLFNISSSFSENENDLTDVKSKKLTIKTDNRTTLRQNKSERVLLTRDSKTQ
jgi:hypothetical protein